MGCFFWSGQDIEGKKVEGGIECSDVSEGKKQLYKKNIFKLKFSRISEFQLNAPLSDEMLVNFLNNLHRLLKSGMEFYDSLNFIIRFQTNHFYSYIISMIRQDLSEGKRLSEAFQRYHCFPPIFIQLIQVAENTDRLPEAIQYLLDYFEIKNRMLKERQKILSYPMTVLGIAFILFLGLLVYVVPMFKRMFLSLKGNLPASTKGMIMLSDSLRFYPFYWVVGGIICMFGVWYFYRLKGGTCFINFFPGGRKIVKSSMLYTYANSLNMMLKSGVHLSHALTLAETIFSTSMKYQIKELHEQIASGQPLEETYKNMPFFPPIFVQLVGIGESSGSLSAAFERIALIFQEDIEKRTSKMNALIEPVLMIFISVGVLMVLLSIYLPIFSLASHF
ncbi:type II secretion system F family protein [Deltaproteobacteria bacterium TL4]